MWCCFRSWHSPFFAESAARDFVGTRVSILGGLQLCQTMDRTRSFLVGNCLGFGTDLHLDCVARPNGYYLVSDLAPALLLGCGYFCGLQVSI